MIKKYLLPCLLLLLLTGCFLGTKVSKEEELLHRLGK